MICVPVGAITIAALRMRFRSHAPLSTPSPVAEDCSQVLFKAILDLDWSSWCYCRVRLLFLTPMHQCDSDRSDIRMIDSDWASCYLLPHLFLLFFQRSLYSCSHMVWLSPKYHIVLTRTFSTAYPKNIIVLTSTYAYFSTASPNIVHKKRQKLPTTDRSTSSPPVQLMSS